MTGISLSVFVLTILTTVIAFFLSVIKIRSGKISDRDKTDLSSLDKTDFGVIPSGVFKDRAILLSIDDINKDDADFQINRFNTIRRREEKKWAERNIRDNKHIVLFIGAEIEGASHIGIKEDSETIRGALAGSEVFHVIEKNDIKRDELVPLISKYKPSILHFDGHGAEDGRLAFLGEDGNCDLIAPTEISGVMNIAKSYLKVAYFDACYSSSHAQYAVLSIDAAIGNEGECPVKIARTFARQFYCSLEDGHSVADAYGFAKEHIKIVEHDSRIPCPMLETNIGVEATDIKFVKKESRI